jgi:hypothetical protein
MQKHFHLPEPNMICVTAHHAPGRKEVSFLIKMQRGLAESIPFEFDYVREAEVFTFEDKINGGIGVYFIISHRLDYEAVISALIEAGFLEWPPDAPMPWLPA